jgi:hypothetical protein
MLCVPTVSVLLAHAAWLLPFTATAAQPVRVAVPSVNATVPVGDEPAMVAVNVTSAPGADGLAELASVVVVAGRFTVCVSVALAEPVLRASPPYVATIVCAPPGSELVVHAAWLLATATAPQPLIVLPASVNATVPVGVDAPIVAVNVTAVPSVDGLLELDSVVADVTLFTTSVSAELVDAPLFASPP